MIRMKIKDICDLQNGRAFKPSDWGTAGLPIIRIQNLNDERAPFNYYGGKYNLAQEVDNGDLLFSWSGTPGTSFGAFLWNRGKGVLNQHIFKVIPKVEIDKTYLMYALNGNISTIISKAHGGVGLQHITKKELDEIEIQMVSISRQKKIVEILEKISLLIFLRKQQLEKLDEVVKARFVEMFGDPKDNRSNLVKIGEIGDLTSGGTPSRSNSEYFNGSIRWYSAGELNSLYLPDSIEHISRTALSQSAAKLFEKGTLMIGMYDTAAFKMGILTEQSSSNQACANLKPTEQYSVIWLYYLFDIMKPIFLNERQGVRQKNLSLSKIRNFNIPSAPLSLQNQFAAFVERVDRQKQTVQQSLEKLELMKKALMQEYFG